MIARRLGTDHLVEVIDKESERILYVMSRMSRMRRNHIPLRTECDTSWTALVVVSRRNSNS